MAYHQYFCREIHWSERRSELSSLPSGKNSLLLIIIFVDELDVALWSRKLTTLPGFFGEEAGQELAKNDSQDSVTPLGCPCCQKYLHSHPRRSLLVEPLRY